MANSKVSVELNLIDNSQAALAQVMENFKKLQSLAKDMPETKLPNLAPATEQVGGFTKALQGLQGAASSALGAAGLGKYGALIGIGGAAGLATLAIGMGATAAKMAYDLDLAANRIAANLTIGAGSISAASASLVAAANAMARGSGYSSQEVMQAMGSYQSASGAGLGQTKGAASSILQYARATGVDLNTIASWKGNADQYGAGNLDLLYGGQSGAGDAGRRDSYREFASSMVQAMQSSSGGGGFTQLAAERLINGVAAGGGYFNSDAGISQGMRGLEAIGSAPRTPFQGAIAVASGANPWEILTGDHSAQNISKRLKTLSRYGKATMSGDEGSNVGLLMQLSGLTGDMSSAAELYRLAGTKYGGDLSKITQADVKAAAPGVLGGRVGDRNSNPAGGIETDLKDIQTAMTNLGQRELPLVKTGLDHVHDAIMKMEPWLSDNTHAMEALAAVMALGFGPAILKSAGGLLRMGGGAARAGIGAAEGVAEGVAERGGMSLLGRVAPWLARIAGVGLLANPVVDAFGLAFTPSSAGNEGEEHDARMTDARRRALGKVPWSDERMLAAITNQESGGNASAMNAKGSGAMGLYQFMPGTADQFVGADFLRRYGSTKTKAGRAAFLRSTRLQHDVALGYLHSLENYGGGKYAHDPYHLAQGWYSGAGGMGHDALPGEYKGDPSNSGYGSSVQDRYYRLAAHDIDVRVTVRPKQQNRTHPVTNRPTPNRTSGRAHQ